AWVQVMAHCDIGHQAVDPSKTMTRASPSTGNCRLPPPTGTEPRNCRTRAQAERPWQRRMHLPHADAVAAAWRGGAGRTAAGRHRRGWLAGAAVGADGERHEHDEDSGQPGDALPQ